MAGNEKGIQYVVKGMTLVFALLFAGSFGYVSSYGHYGTTFPAWLVVLIAGVGVLIVMWIADKISAQGLFDGRILLVCFSFLLYFPGAIVAELLDKLQDFKILQLGIEIVVWLLITYGIIAFTQAIRYIPLKYHEENQGVGNANLRIHLNMLDEFPLAMAINFALLEIIIIFLELFISSYEPNPLMYFLMDLPLFISLLIKVIFIFLFTYLLGRFWYKPSRFKDFLESWNASPDDLLETLEESVLEKENYLERASARSTRARCCWTFISGKFLGAYF